MLKIITSSAILLLFTGVASAQQGSNASGGDANGSGGSVSYTIGQIDYQHSEGDNVSINQGLQQPYEIFVLTGTDIKEIDLKFSVYPNPSSDYVKLSVGEDYIDNTTYSLYDMSGKQLMHENIVTGETTISLLHLADAAYILKINNSNNSEIKSFKIILNK